MEVMSPKDEKSDRTNQKSEEAKDTSYILSNDDVRLNINTEFSETTGRNEEDFKVAMNGVRTKKNSADLSNGSYSSCEKGVSNDQREIKIGDPAREEKVDESIQRFEDRLPDGGWGWVVVFGAALILILVDIVGQCFGILFSSFLLELETPSAMTAWIFNLFSFVWCMTGPPLGPLIAEFGWRNLTFIGSFLVAAATISSAFVTAAWPLFLTYSLLAGTGCGIISNISYMIVPHYFKNRRGLANGIIMAFDCGGQLIGSPLIQLLQDEYTYTGATLIVGGVILNCCIGAAVFHPVEWHLKPELLKGLRDADSPVETPPRPDLGEVGPSESHVKVFLRLMKSTVANLVILKSARAVMIAVATTVTFTGYLNFLAVVPFAMQENGYSLKEAALCVSVSAICNVITRVVVASLSDTRWFNFRISMMIGSLTISSTMVWFTCLQDLTLIKVTMGLWGCGVGVFMSIFNLVMVHYMGLHNLTRMLGASMLCIAIGYLVIGPFAGYLRDATNSYNVCIWFLAISVFSSFLLWFMIPFTAAYNHEEEQPKQDNEKKLE